MLRVASLGKHICDNWVGLPIQKEDVIWTSLMHDIAKPMSFKLDVTEKFVSSKAELERLKILKNNLIQKYGTDEHLAMGSICREIGLSNRICSHLENFDWLQAESFLESENWEGLIPIYCDMRISPYGIMHVEERITDLATRTPVTNFRQLLHSGQRVQEELQKHVAVTLSKITKDTLLKKEKELLSYKI